MYNYIYRIIYTVCILLNFKKKQTRNLTSKQQYSILHDSIYEDLT